MPKMTRIEPGNRIRPDIPRLRKAKSRHENILLRINFGQNELELHSRLLFFTRHDSWEYVRCFRICLLAPLDMYGAR